MDQRLILSAKGGIPGWIEDLAPSYDRVLAFLDNCIALTYLVFHVLVSNSSGPHEPSPSNII